MFAPLTGASGALVIAAAPRSKPSAAIAQAEDDDGVVDAEIVPDDD
jgi:hypothetical protein